MLKLYRRHLATCTHAPKGRVHLRCKCPIWVDGMLAGKRLHKSMKMRDWDKASGKIRDWDAAGKVEAEPEPTAAVEKSIEVFMVDARHARMLAVPTLKKYRVLFDQLKGFCSQRGFRYVSQLDLQALREFQASWKDGAISSCKKLERLRAFYAFLVDGEIVAKNLAKLLKRPKVRQCPTLPFTSEEMQRLVDGTSGRLRALLLLLRYSGLRVQDAASCAVHRLVDGKILIHTAKTGQAVYCVLPSMCLQALADVERVSEAYWFWTGQGSKDTLAGNYRRMFRNLDVGVKNVHPHRFRDTFAVELLLSGVPLERVSVLLGHSSVKVTEKHYSPWVKSRQNQAEEDVRKSWQDDAVLIGGKARLEIVR